MAIEFERRFLLATLPEGIPDTAWQTIRQGYLAIDSLGEVRLREQQGYYTLTAKSGQGAAREEVEMDLTAAQFDAFWPLARERSLHKRRAVLPLSAMSAPGATLFIDEYLAPVRFLLAEMEFENEQDMNTVDLPAFLGPEVTDIATMRTFSQLLARVKQWQIMGQ